MTKRRKSVGLMLGIVALAGALAPAAPQPPDPNKALAQEQLKLARQALQDLDRMHQGGEVALYDPKFARWERRQVEAIRDAGATQAEFVAALEGHVKRLKDLQQVVETGFQKDQVSRVDVYDAKYRVLEAEMWLNQEKARSLAQAEKQGAAERWEYNWVGSFSVVEFNKLGSEGWELCVAVRQNDQSSPVFVFKRLKK